MIGFSSKIPCTFCVYLPPKIGSLVILLDHDYRVHIKHLTYLFWVKALKFSSINQSLLRPYALHYIFPALPASLAPYLFLAKAPKCLQKSPGFGVHNKVNM